MASPLEGSGGLASALWVVAAALVTAVALRTALFLRGFLRIKAGLATVPAAPGGNWALGHVIPLLKCTLRGVGAWDVMEEWLKASKDGIVKYQILGTQGVAVSSPQALKRIFQTRQRVYEKDLDLSYHPFLPILGTGLVTSDGDLWQKQRVLIGPALRTDILDDIIVIAKNATDRMTEKIESMRGTGKALDLEEEFRLLTLQVIGEAVLSLPPEECDRVGAGGHGGGGGGGRAVRRAACAVPENRPRPPRSSSRRPAPAPLDPAPPRVPPVLPTRCSPRCICLSWRRPTAACCGRTASTCPSRLGSTSGAAHQQGRPQGLGFFGGLS
jgi:hypothetical protein